MNRHLPLAVAVLLAGCESEPAAPPAPTPAVEGVSLNGTAVAGGPLRTDTCNSTALTGGPTPYAGCHNGPLLAGPLVSVALAGVALADGRALDGAVALDGTTFTGTSGGVPVTSFVGAVFTGQLANGSTVPVRIDSASAGTGDDADVWAYGVSYRDSSGAWWPVCAGGAGAVPVMGRWDYSQGTATGGDQIDDPTAFTFGCIGSAIAKCVYLGYKPWRTFSGVSLVNHHQACIRAIRADYCGNGASYTTTGRVIDIFDDLGLEPNVNDGWIAEGEWTPAGARCTFALNRNIVGGLLCNPLGSLTCGHWTPGVLIRTETPLDSIGLLSTSGVATQPR